MPLTSFLSERYFLRLVSFMYEEKATLSQLLEKLKSVQISGLVIEYRDTADPELIPAYIPTYIVPSTSRSDS